MNMKYNGVTAALLSHCATRDLQLLDCVWSLTMPHLIRALPHSAVMAQLRTAIWAWIVGIDCWLWLLLDIQCVLQENVNNLKRKFQQCCTVIRARAGYYCATIASQTGRVRTKPLREPSSTSPSAVCTALAWPSSAAIGFGFLAASGVSAYF